MSIKTPSSSIFRPEGGVDQSVLREHKALIEEIDRTLETLPAGHKDFAALLQAQKVAISLAEHVSSSLDSLEPFAVATEKPPVRIVHTPKLAAAE